MVQVALNNNHGDIDVLAGLLLIDDGDFEAMTIDVINFFGMIDDTGSKVTLGLVRLPDPFTVFVKLGGIEGAGKKAFKEERVRNAHRFQILHGAHDVAMAEGGIA